MQPLEATDRRAVPITTQMNLKNIMLIGEKKTKKTVTLPFTLIKRTDKNVHFHMKSHKKIYLKPNKWLSMGETDSWVQK